MLRSNYTYYTHLVLSYYAPLVLYDRASPTSFYVHCSQTFPSPFFSWNYIFVLSSSSNWYPKNHCCCYVENGSATKDFLRYCNPVLCLSNPFPSQAHLSCFCSYSLVHCCYLESRSATEVNSRSYSANLCLTLYGPYVKYTDHNECLTKKLNLLTVLTCYLYCS